MGTLRVRMTDHMVGRGYSVRTTELYTDCVWRFAHHFKKSPLEITPDEIVSFLVFLRREGRSESTIHIYYEALRLFYQMEHLEGRMPGRLVRGAKGKLPTILSQREVFALLESCESLRYRTIFTLIYSAGLRVSEAANLRPYDIDFERRHVFIRNGKNGKDRYTLLARETALLLDQYQQIYRPGEWLFYTNDIGRRITTDAIQKAFRQLTERFAPGKNLHVHTLRHCFATHLLENGTDLFRIMRLLGHTSILTTMAYLHLAAPACLDVESPIDRHYFDARGERRGGDELALEG